MIGKIHSFETFGTLDGPGIRFVIFMQGCCLKCKYCHNRDTWSTHSGKMITIEELVKENIVVLREMGERDEFFNSIANLLSITNLKMGFEEIDEVLNRTSLVNNIKNFKFDNCLDYIPPQIYGEKESYFSTNSIPNRKRRKNIWGK